MRARLIAAVTLALAARMAEAAGPTEITACTTITQPGSYILVNNLTPASPGDCLVVDADFVTIDLGGFLIRGATRSGGRFGFGIGTPAPDLPADSATTHRGVTVRNGTIAEFKWGIWLNGRDIEIERVRALDNKFEGIHVGNGSTSEDMVLPGSSTAVVRDCVAAGNGDIGIALYPSSVGLVTGNLVSSNNQGILITTGTVIGNLVWNNLLRGIWVVEEGSSVVNNSVFTSTGGAPIGVACPSAVVGNAGMIYKHSSNPECTLAHNAVP